MSKELVLFCQSDGKWAVYDNTYDITIHCESKQEQDETLAMLCKAIASAGEVMGPEEMVRYLMGLCRCRLATGNGCPGCPFDKQPVITETASVVWVSRKTGTSEEVQNG